MSQNRETSEEGLTLDHAATGTEVKLRRDDVRWVIRTTWQEALFSANLPDWFNLDHDPRASKVKTGYRRGVWRVELGDRVVYAKIVAADGESVLARILVALGRTASHREWAICLAAVRRGAPVIRPVAFGVRGGPSPATVLITEAFGNAQSLSAAWNGAVAETGFRNRQTSIARLTRCVADLFADAHRAGFVHLDGHPGNILIASTNAGTCVARYADVSDARLSNGHPPWTQIVRSVAHLDHYMKRFATRTQRLRFLRDYLERLRAPQSHQHEIWMERRILPAVFACERVHAAALARQRDRRITRRGRYFTPLTLGAGWRATVVLSIERRHVFPESKTSDFDEARWRELLAGIDDGHDGIGIVRKRLASCGLSVQTASAGGVLGGLFWRTAGSRARQVFFRCHALRHRDIRAPLVLAFVEHRSAFGGIDRTLLIYPARHDD